MTIQRLDGIESEFSAWTRLQPGFDTRKTNFRTYDVDYVWWCKTTWETTDGPLLLLEEKCKDAQMQPDQAKVMKRMNDDFLTCDRRNEFKGFHIITFSNTSPTNGLMWLDSSLISIDDLIKFLQFQAHPDMYISWFQKLENNGQHYTQFVSSRRKY